MERKKYNTLLLCGPNVSVNVNVFVLAPLLFFSRLGMPSKNSNEIFKLSDSSELKVSKMNIRGLSHLQKDEKLLVTNNNGEKEAEQ